MKIWSTLLLCTVLSVCNRYNMDPNAVQGTGLLRVGNCGGRPRDTGSEASKAKAPLGYKKKPHTHQQIQRGAEKKKTKVRQHKAGQSHHTKKIWRVWSWWLYAVADCREWATGVLMGWERAGVVWKVEKYRVQREMGQILTLCSTVWQEGQSLTCLTCTCGQGK